MLQRDSIESRFIINPIKSICILVASLGVGYRGDEPTRTIDPPSHVKKRIEYPQIQDLTQSFQVLSPFSLLQAKYLCILVPRNPLYMNFRSSHRARKPRRSAPTQIARKCRSVKRHDIARSTRLVRIVFPMAKDKNNETEKSRNKLTKVEARLDDLGFVSVGE